MCGSGDILFSNLSWPGITTSSLIRSAAALAADRAAVIIVRVYFMVNYELCNDSVLALSLPILLQILADKMNACCRYFRFRLCPPSRTEDFRECCLCPVGHFVSQLSPTFSISPPSPQNILLSKYPKSKTLHPNLSQPSNHSSNSQHVGLLDTATAAAGGTTSLFNTCLLSITKNIYRSYHH